MIALWTALIFFADPAPPTKSDPAKVVPAKSVEAEKAKPSVRLRRTTKPSTDQKEASKDSKDAAPQEGKRKIPAPDERRSAPDLDKELLGELGQDLEAGKTQDDEDPLLRAGKRMREAENKLSKKEQLAGVIDLQKKIVADLDELLKQNSQGSPPPQDPNKKPKPKDRPADKKMQKKQSSQKQQQTAKQSTKSAEKAGPNRSGREEFGNPDQTKEVWGHLTPVMREEMSQYAKEAFLEKYRDLLELYYAAIADQSRTKGE